MERYAVLKWGYSVGVQGESVFIDFDPGELVITKKIADVAYYRIYKLDRSISFSCNKSDFDFLNIQWEKVK